MESEYDLCYKNLISLIDWYETNKIKRNEATTRLHLIDTVLYECLGWNREDIQAEEPYDDEYADYTIYNPRRIMIVEAKRDGIYFEIPTTKDSLEYSIQSLIRDSGKLKEAIEQAMGYC